METPRVSRQTKVLVVDVMGLPHCLGWGGVVQPCAEEPPPFLPLGFSQPPGGKAAGRVSCTRVLVRGGDSVWGSSGQLGPPPVSPCPPPALPGLRPHRTCRMGGLCPTGVARHPLPDLVGEMGPAWGGHVPGTPPLILDLMASRAWCVGMRLVTWATTLLALGGWPALSTLCVRPADGPRLAPLCVLLGCPLGFAQWGGRLPGHLPPAGWGPAGCSSSWCHCRSSMEPLSGTARPSHSLLLPPVK